MQTVMVNSYYTTSLITGPSISAAYHLDIHGQSQYIGQTARWYDSRSIKVRLYYVPISIIAQQSVLQNVHFAL